MPVRLPPAVPERLDGLASMTTSPVWVLHGPGVGDEMVGRDHIVRTFDQVLWEVLVARGFKRIVFSDLHQPVYFLDTDSHRLSQPDDTPLPRTRRMTKFSGPLNDTIVMGERETRQRAAPRVVSDPSRVQMLDGLMKEASPRTAIIVADAENVLSHMSPNSRRGLAAAVKKWTAGDAHRNVCVFLFGQQQFSEVTENVRQLGYLPQFATYLEAMPDRQVCLVSLPEQGELARLVHVTRLRDGLGIGSWTRLPHVVRTIAAQTMTTRQWRRELQIMAEDQVPLDLDQLRENDLVADSRPDGRSAQERLASMTGLQPVKDFLRQRAAAIAAEMQLRKRGLGDRQDATSPHLVFTGNPGTGKTTVAGLVGEIYRDLGLLRRGHVVAPSMDELVAGYVGQTAQLMRRRVLDSLDGVLFIDEAYQLSNQRAGFGQEAIDTLLTEMERHRDRLVVIVAGYPDEMREFLGTNTGLGRRFPQRNIVEFPDFTPDELHRIVLRGLRAEHLEPTPDLEKALAEITAGLHRTRDKHFGNAGAMRELVAELKDCWALRTELKDGEPLPQATVEDIPERYRSHQIRHEVSINDVLGDLDGMVGLAPVKQSIRELTATLALRRRRGMGDPIAPHMVFQGPPGTGKTTVARLVGKMLCALGLLANGHVVEATRATLVAPYIGQTAPMTREKIEEAMDGVLFIDEAYSLIEGSGGQDFGREAITELLYQMENRRGRLVVIAAGYPDAMTAFLASNDGLRSRFTKRITFPDYSSPELRQILEQFAGREGYSFAEGTQAHALRWLESCRSVQGPAFANARTVRTLMESMESRLGHRIAGMLDTADEATLNTFVALDVPTELP